jgi:hypothetical protein
MGALPSSKPCSEAREALPPRSDTVLPTRGPEGLEPSRHGCCQAHVGSEEAPSRGWPPSAAQTARTVFP